MFKSRAKPRKVLDCANPLALFRNALPFRKRWRAGAVQDAAASSRVPGYPFVQWVVILFALKFLGFALLWH